MLQVREVFMQIWCHLFLFYFLSLDEVFNWYHTDQVKTPQTEITLTIVEIYWNLRNHYMISSLWSRAAKNWLAQIMIFYSIWGLSHTNLVLLTKHTLRLWWMHWKNLGSISSPRILRQFAKLLFMWYLSLDFFKVISLQAPSRYLAFNCIL